MDREVVVTGMGVISSIGDTIDEFKEGLYEGRSGIKWTDEEILRVAAKIDQFSLDTFMKNRMIDIYDADRILKLTRRMPMYVQASTAAVLDACKQAGLEKGKFNPDHVGIIAAGSNLNQKYVFDTAIKFINSNNFVNPTYALKFFDTNLIGVLSEILSITGEGMTVGGASASGNMAIINAYRMIRAGICDICIVVGPPFEYSPMEIQAFMNLGAIGICNFKEPHEVSRPFDKGHIGFVPGQSASCIILESDKSAKERSVEVLAEIKSGSIILDGNHLSNASQSGEERAMEKAIKEAGINKSDIDYINAHGTSTPSGDETEANAIASVFGEMTNNIWVNSTKSLIGHCMYSAGIVEAIACILQMKYQFVHPNINLKEPVRWDIKFSGNTSQKADICYALSNSMAFGGINTSIVLCKR